MQTDREIKLNWMMPLKRKFVPTDSFFQDGDACCYGGVKQLAEELEDLAFADKRKEITCNIASCDKAFTSIASFENHYNSTHRNICNHCRRNFPSSRFLEIHVLESHDTLFEMLCQKQNMYECLVDGCQEKFATSDIRLKHLITVHQYPKNFRFATKLTTKKKQQENVSPVKDRMDIEEAKFSDMTSVDSFLSAESRSKGQDRVPKQFSFGRGKGRGFQNPSSGKKRRGKKKEKRDHCPENMQT